MSTDESWGIYWIQLCCAAAMEFPCILKNRSTFCFKLEMPVKVSQRNISILR